MGRYHRTVIMKTSLFVGRIFHSMIFCFAIVSIFILTLETPIFCGPIHDASYTGDLTKVKALLKDKPKMVFSKDSWGFTPLYLAAANRHKDVIELLLANRAKPNDAKNKCGLAPLAVAVINNYKDIVELLLTHGADVNIKTRNGDTALHLAVIFSHKDIVKVLLDNKADVNAKTKKGQTPLGIASSEDIVELIRQHGGHE